jgi:SAM-dependent methyltransferase
MGFALSQAVSVALPVERELAGDGFMRREVDGYIEELPYNLDYYRAGSPEFLRLVARSRSIPFPPGPLRYLELGYGGGVSLNVHAAASPGTYWGTDINPTHIAETARLAQCSGARTNVLGLPLAELLALPDLPKFDVIVAFGLWSWISDNNRAAILDLLRMCLADGGLSCMSSLALPKNAALIPLKRALRLHTRGNRETTDYPQALRDGVRFASALRAAGSDYFNGREAAGEVEKIERRYGQRIDEQTFIHEYMQEHWRPALLVDTATELREASLQFAGNMSLLDGFDDLNFKPDARTALDGIDDFWERETAKEFLRPRRVRYDLFVKGGAEGSRKVPVTPDRSLSFVLAVPAFQARAMTARAPSREIALSGSPFGEIFDCLESEDYRPKSLGELANLLSPAGLDMPEIFRALMIMVHEGIAHPACQGPLSAEAIESSHRLNREILRLSRVADGIGVLASPVTGGGVPVTRIQRLFLGALLDGATSLNDWAAGAAKVMANEANATPGRAQETPDLVREALYFSTLLPVLKALMVVPNAP